MKRLGLFVGLTKLDPSAYDDWDGYCPGCDRDVARFARKCHQLGFDGLVLLVNEAATRAAVAAAYQSLVARLSVDDLLLLYFSGHGGQLRDISGDEKDGWDETLCFWDGEGLDDTMGAMFSWAPRGSRIWHITDCCNGGTNCRGAPRVRQRRGNCANILHFGGSDDGKYAFGDEDGGHFTRALLDALGDARKLITYGELFERTVARLEGGRQRLTMGELGTSFADREAGT